MNTETLETYTSQLFSVAPGVWGRKEVFVNFYMIQDDETGNWVLVDAGLKWSASNIKSMAAEIFGEGSRPIAIILTHGHFDHVGSVAGLAKEWEVPVYAHPMEMPYLNGTSSYPPPDPSVGGGLMSLMAFLYPTGPINISEYLEELPYDGTVPGLSGWKYIHTPGHSPGHVSLFRESDRVLIAGDALVTTKQESAIHALAFTKILSGPPKYFTCNWASAKQSALKILALDPEVMAAGHGKPMEGEELREALSELTSHFDEMAVPATGRYVNEPAVTNENGVMYLPPSTDKVTAVIKAVGVTFAIAGVAWLIFNQLSKSENRERLKSLVGKVSEKVAMQTH